MKICCLIDSLNSGGAQRQMTWLVRALTGNGHQVRLLTYYEYDHYLKLIRDCGVEPENIDSTTKVGRFWKFRSAIRVDAPDVIISFLDTPNFIGLFASLPPNHIPIIVSERNHNIEGKTRAASVRFNAFRLASKVVTNCYSQQEFIRENYSFLKSKLSTILNCVDLEKFTPTKSSLTGQIKLLVAASVCERKNAIGLIRACKHLAEEKIDLKIDWFGNDFFQNGEPTPESSYFQSCQARIKQLLPDGEFEFHKSVQNIETKYKDYHGCCLPSFREGCPNVICEAMSSGLPCLVSDHGDMRRMIDSSRGFLFDPSSPESIAAAIAKFSALTEEERSTMGRRNRIYAEEHLGPERFANEYDSLIKEIVN